MEKKKQHRKYDNQFKEGALRQVANGAKRPRCGLGHFQPTDLRVVYEFVQTESMNYSITQLCDVLQLSRSPHYAYCAGDSYGCQPRTQGAIGTGVGSVL